MVLDEVPKQFLDLLEEFIHVAEQTLKTEHHSATKIYKIHIFRPKFLRTVQMVRMKFIICFEKYRSEMFIKTFV